MLFNSKVLDEGEKENHSPPETVHKKIRRKINMVSQDLCRKKINGRI